MAKTFKYRVCQTQAGHVTFINGRWQGNQALLESYGYNAHDAMRSCPALWEYLEVAGREGWQLIAVAPHASTLAPETANMVNLVFLMKEEEA